MYIRGLDTSLKPAIYTAAFIEYWDYELMMAVGDSFIASNAIALKIQLWLTWGERKWHEETISDTVEVLDDVRKYCPSERLIYLSALNDLGISWKRFKKFDQAFFYQNQVVNALKDKKAKDLVSWNLALKYEESPVGKPPPLKPL